MNLLTCQVKETRATLLVCCSNITMVPEKFSLYSGLTNPQLALNRSSKNLFMKSFFTRARLHRSRAHCPSSKDDVRSLSISCLRIICVFFLLRHKKNMSLFFLDHDVLSFGVRIPVALPCAGCSCRSVLFGVEIRVHVPY